MIEILSSPSAKLVNASILNSVKTLNDSAKEVYIVVPEMFTYTSEIQVMDYLDLESMINIKIISFQRMTEMVLSKDGGIKRQRIDDVGKALIIRKLMNENPDNFKLYKGMVDKDGFYSKLLNLIKEFKNSLIDPNTITEQAQYCETDLLKEKLEEISLIYSGLEYALKNKYVDNEDRLNQLLETLENSNIFENKNVFFWQFSSFSKLEYNIIKMLIKNKAKITIGLIFRETDKIDNDFKITEKTKNEIEKISMECKVDYFEEELKGDLVPPEYKCIIGSSIEEEVSNVAGKIRLLIDKNVKLNDIAMIYSQEEYKTQVKRVFNEYKMPVLINDKESLITTAVSSWIRNMLYVVIYGFKYENVIGFLKSCLNLFTSEEVQVFENYVLRKNIRGEMYFREKYFIDTNYISEEEEFIVKKIRLYIENGFKKLKSINKKQQPLIELIGEFFDALKSFQFIEMIDRFLDELEKEELFKEIEIVEQSYSAVVDIIDQMVDTLSEEKMTLQEFTSLLESGFKQKKIGAIPQGNNQIILSSLEEGLSGNYKWIFFLGANSEQMPRAKKVQGLLSDSELSEIKNIELNTRKILDLEECHNLYKVLAMAEDGFVFSYSKISIDGKKQKPSTYIKQYNADILMTKKTWESRLDPMLYSLGTIIRNYVEYEKITEDDIKLLAKNKKNKSLKSKMDIILKDESLDKEDFKISEAKARLIYKEPLELSVTRIHQMTKCEFAHFIKYGISPRERVVATIEPKELGSLLHSFVENFSEELKSTPQIVDDFTQEEVLKMADRLYQEKIDDFLDKESLESNRNNYLLGKLKRSAVTLGKLMIEQVKASEFNIYGQEVYFGKNSDLPEVNLSNNSYDAWIKGQIDRVDFFEQDGKKYIRIIDYKSSGKVFSLSDNYNLIDVQLMTYMAAALSGNENAKPGGAFYLPLIEKPLSVEDNEMDKIDEMRQESYKMDGLAISEEDILKKMDVNISNKKSNIKLKGRGGITEKTNLFSEQEFNGLISHIKKEIGTQLNSLFEGSVKINPYIKENSDTGCKFCNYRSICGLDAKLDKERLRKLVEFDVVSIKKKVGGGK